MKSRSSAKLMVVCWVAFGLIVASHHLVWGMNKADLVEKMAGEAGISKVAAENAFSSNYLQAPAIYAVNQGTWLNHPPIILGGPTQPVVSCSEAYATYWVSLPPYNVLWPLWSPALSPTNAAQFIESPLLVMELNPAFNGGLIPVVPTLTPILF